MDVCIEKKFVLIIIILKKVETNHGLPESHEEKYFQVYFILGNRNRYSIEFVTTFSSRDNDDIILQRFSVDMV